jgi:hypothetical protein
MQRSATSNNLVEHAEPSSQAGDYLKVPETAGRACVAPKTLYNWISLGRIGPGEGVCHIGRKVVIHWPTFEATVLRGTVNGAA